MVVFGKPVYLSLFLKDDINGIAFEDQKSVNSGTPGKRKKERRKTSVEFLLHLEEFDNMDIDKEALMKIYDVPHIKLPLKVYIREFIAELKNEKKLEQSAILSKEELQLLFELRQDKVLEITVKMNNHNFSKKSQIERIEVTRELKKSAESRLIETYTSKEYADISYKVADGQIVSFKKVTKIKP